MMATDRHRSTSFTNAFTYGRCASSWNVGLRCGPTTWSSSSHAFGSVSGKAQQASTKVTSVELEVRARTPCSGGMGEKPHILSYLEDR